MQYIGDLYIFVCCIVYHYDYYRLIDITKLIITKLTDSSLHISDLFNTMVTPLL